jgi:hypothetical protein
MNLTPKKDFLEKKEFANAHRDLVVSTSFREALNAALLEYVMTLVVEDDTLEAAAAAHQIVGARDFINHLLNIAEQPKTPPTPTPTNLDHRVK